MKTEYCFTSDMYFCMCILMSFWVTSGGSLKDPQIRGGSSKNHLIIYYSPNAGGRNVCFFFFSSSSLSAGHCKSRDEYHMTRSKDLFLWLLGGKKKQNRSPIKAVNVYYAVSLLDFLVLCCYCKNKMSGKICWQFLNILLSF